MKGLFERSSGYELRLKREERQRLLKRQQDEVVASAADVKRPNLIFGSLSDELWLWANTAGYREHQVLRNVLPSMPDEMTQSRFTGFSGDETLTKAFDAYSLVKRLSEKYLDGISGLHSVLDFGCGWGRMARFFLRDLDPSKIWGVDCLARIIAVCQQTNKWCNFRVVDPLPPTTFPGEMFDLIYSYSVFSHLSEDAHKKWLLEFNRILRPGGLLIATTRGREFIEYCEMLRHSKGRPPDGVETAFPYTKQSLSDYDNGMYCYYPLGGGDILDASFYGETCIPKVYVLNHWTKDFTFLEYFESGDVELQNTIVVKKFV
jgi:SAM-dependent methyltransferase